MVVSPYPHENPKNDKRLCKLKSAPRPLSSLVRPLHQWWCGSQYEGRPRGPARYHIQAAQLGPNDWVMSPCWWWKTRKNPDVDVNDVYTNRLKHHNIHQGFWFTMSTSPPYNRGSPPRHWRQQQTLEWQQSLVLGDGMATSASMAWVEHLSLKMGNSMREEIGKPHLQMDISFGTVEIFHGDTGYKLFRWTMVLTKSCFLGLAKPGQAELQPDVFWCVYWVVVTWPERHDCLLWMNSIIGKWWSAVIIIIKQICLMKDLSI